MSFLPGLAVQGVARLFPHELLAADGRPQLVIRRPFLANRADAALVGGAPGINQRFIGRPELTEYHRTCLSSDA
jgi:hypothetical protein